MHSFAQSNLSVDQYGLLEIMSILNYLTSDQVFLNLVMELRQLRSLCLIAEHGTVKEAAKRSFRTSSAISLQIKELERELGIKLLEWTGKKFILTSEGEFFYDDARRILEIAHEATEKARTQVEDFTGRISLAAPACLRTFYLPTISRYRAAYPSIRLTIFARSHVEAPSMINSGEADLAMGLFQRPFPDLEEIRLVAPRLILIIPISNQLASRKRVGIKELSCHNLVVLQPSTTTRKVIDAAFRRDNLNLKLGMEASTCTDIKRYVVNNVGIGIIHNICFEAEDASRLRSVNIHGFSNHPEAKLIFRRSKKLTVAEKRLIEFLRSES